MLMLLRDQDITQTGTGSTLEILHPLKELFQEALKVIAIMLRAIDGKRYKVLPAVTKTIFTNGSLRTDQSIFQLTGVLLPLLTRSTDTRMRTAKALCHPVEEITIAMHLIERKLHFW